MQARLTLEDVAAAQAVHYIDTLYGYQIGIRKLSASFVTRTQLLFTPPVAIEGGGHKDPLGIGFLDVACPACSAGPKITCEQLGSEPVPHEGRVIAAHHDRVGRGNRGALRASIVDPVVTDDLLVFLESNPRALVSLMEQIVELNGLGGEARTEASRTFREGIPGQPTVSP